MKKFIDKKVMDWKFKKAGEGHSLSEEKKAPPKQQPPSQQGELAIYTSFSPFLFAQSYFCISC